MSRTWISMLVGILAMGVAGTARADWNDSDPYKMHYPQLPNYSGQDMENILADDWECTGTGPVSDIHFWTFNESFNPQAPIYVTIYGNDLDYHELGYSAPSVMLWDRYFSQEDYTIRLWEPFHWQFNITDIPDPFVQQEGQIYWLGLRIQLWNDPHLYWNYSDSSFMDKATSWDGTEWFPLSSDLAFVITPEPATMGLLALGGLALIRRRR